MSVNFLLVTFTQESKPLGASGTMLTEFCICYDSDGGRESEREVKRKIEMYLAVQVQSLNAA